MKRQAGILLIKHIFLSLFICLLVGCSESSKQEYVEVAKLRNSTIDDLVEMFGPYDILNENGESYKLVFNQENATWCYVFLGNSETGKLYELFVTSNYDEHTRQPLKIFHYNDLDEILKKFGVELGEDAKIKSTIDGEATSYIISNVNSDIQSIYINCMGDNKQKNTYTYFYISFK